MTRSQRRELGPAGAGRRPRRTRTRAPAPGQHRRGDPAVGTVAALARHHDDAPAVGAAQHPERGVGHRRAGPRHEGLVRDAWPGRRRRPPASRRGSGRRARRGRAVLRHDEGDGHAVGVGEREVELSRAPGAGQRRRPCRAARARGRCGWRPRPVVRRTSTSVSAKAPMPVPSAFMTASLAAKRAARLWAASAERRGVGLLGVGEAARRRSGAARRARGGTGATSTASTPTPTMRAHSTVTVLARLRGRSGRARAGGPAGRPAAAAGRRRPPGR